MKIYISGLYSGTNPQPGIGIARSLRAAYPGATLVGVEYSNRCSGIHWQDFDEIVLHRPWDELNLDAHAREIKRVLESGALWVSSIDLEIMWFASLFPGGHPNLLTPSLAALNQVGKPAIPAHEYLPVKIPTFVTTELSDWDLHAFCREHDWKVWLKGPYYEAVRVHGWGGFQDMRSVLSSAWATEKLFAIARLRLRRINFVFRVSRRIARLHPNAKTRFDRTQQNLGGRCFRSRRGNARPVARNDSAYKLDRWRGIRNGA